MFALTMFVIELILLNRNMSPLKMNKLTNHSMDNCLSETQTRLELKDLKQMKKSFLNELKRIEQKRNHLLNKLDLIREKIDDANNELERLKERNRLLTMRLIENQLSIEQFKTQQLQDEPSPLFNYSIVKPNILVRSKNANNEEISCSLEQCFDFAKCPVNHKLNVYLFNQPKEFELDLLELSFSMEFVSEPSQSCLVLVFLDYSFAKSETSFYAKLTEFMQNALQNPPNFLFISLDVDSNQVQSKWDLIRLMNSSTKSTNEKAQLIALLNRSMFASFNHSKQHSDTDR
jgi:hypothetical protein